MLELRCEVLLTPDDDISLLVFFPMEGTNAAEQRHARCRRFAEDSPSDLEMQNPAILVFTGIAGSYFRVGPVGIEPTTHGLKVRRSTN